MAQQNQRKTSDRQHNNVHPRTSAEGRTGGNAGADKSGSESLGTEKKIDDERFGSRNRTPAISRNGG